MTSAGDLAQRILVQRQQRGDKPVLMTHLVCGYPSFDANRRMLALMGEIGVGLVEFQFPFSEPVADGPLFCKANQASLASGTRVEDCFALLAEAAERYDFVPVMMGYYNTIYRYGHEAFCARLAAAGGRAMIVPDLPVEEAGPLREAASAHGLALVSLLTPTTPEERLAQVGAEASGFVYCVARRGVTGAKTAFDAEVVGFLERCRAHTSVPLALGFGIGSPADIAFVGAHADIAVIGTAFLRTWEAEGETGARDLLARLAS